MKQRIVITDGRNQIISTIILAGKRKQFGLLIFVNALITIQFSLRKVMNGLCEQ